ncbi:hypothetical protein TTRE_0000653101 [Trichuris trichiura]|uniref:Uncharacterized protein n=1 Tax=Trichuris trichiura TaxID=36087 RepID=A0A077ZEG8_TRITR|nr:hypothetical protein TTRE_0000653101 [Trichuris trichiura]
MRRHMKLHGVHKIHGVIHSQVNVSFWERLPYHRQQSVTGVVPGLMHCLISSINVWLLRRSTGTRKDSLVFRHTPPRDPLSWLLPAIVRMSLGEEGLIDLDDVAWATNHAWVAEHRLSGNVPLALPPGHR